ncbi:hypothetical protein CALCODRAFT_499142 [Calocera cornea HHB12733]|uniref:Mid2 domain-containing protein n=1 Tax=Calocera cornea HHB12733 TaxID=1353952 RepID=A0A165EIV0_9BASI|nr:hypothetical protein CALCODRAFT_499142 [Calocera cornea HHB12733]
MRLLALPLLWAAHALAWSFDVQTYPTQCAPLQLNVTGGTAPYVFTFYRLAGIDTPFSAWANGSVWNTTLPSSDVAGEIDDFILPWTAGTEMVIVGSDATGFATGGTTPVYSVAASSSNETGCLIAQSANTTYLSRVPAWSEPPTECGIMEAIFYGVTLPATVSVIVPGGDSFYTDTGSLQYPTPPSGQDGWGVEHTWWMNLTEGTNVVFQVSDANGPIFTSALVSVAAGNDTCLPGYVPPSSPSGSSGSSGKSKTGAIAGGIIGGLAAAALAAVVVLFGLRYYNRRRRLQKRQTIGLTAYAATKPERLERTTWPEGERYRDDPDAVREGPGEDKRWASIDRRMTTTEDDF